MRQLGLCPTPAAPPIDACVAGTTWTTSPMSVQEVAWSRRPTHPGPKTRSALALKRPIRPSWRLKNGR